MTTSPINAYGIWDTEKGDWWIGKHPTYHSPAAAKSSWNGLHGRFILDESGRIIGKAPRFTEQTRFVVKKIKFVEV